MTGNWIAVSRCVFDHPIVGIHGRAWTEFEAWQWLISSATHRPRSVSNRGHKVQLQRGQLMASYSFLADRYRWSREKARRWIKRLVDDEMVTFEQPVNNTLIPVLTICNYDVYQNAEENHHTPSDTLTDTLATPYQHHNPEEKQDTNKNADTLVSENRHPDRHQYNKDNNKPVVDSPPTPRRRGAERQGDLLSSEARLALSEAEATMLADAKRKAALKLARDTKKRASMVDAMALVADLRKIYNGAAQHFGFLPVPDDAWTPSRDKRHLERVLAIGGKENYRKALFALSKDPFLSGRVPMRDGTVLKLNFETLMRERGPLGDVLGRLMDLAAGPQEIAPVKGKSWGWWKTTDVSVVSADGWRQSIAGKDGEWQWWHWGPPPGHDECFIPAEVISDLNLIAKFGKANHA